MPVCVVCEKVICDSEVIYCFECGRLLCEDCGLSGLCPSCEEVQVSEEDLIDEEELARK